MADENPTDPGTAEPPTPEVQDLRDQAIVLMQVLSDWPVHLTTDDLVREIVADPGNFAERDRVTRAVRDLAGAGLVLRGGSLVLPTRAALHFSRLGEEP
ncbi:MAG TPA: hypothetical protein VLS25_08860 [Dehalococcoidia bacterium]|nr:hypothetical protein [Dehalococcoidia bacterium]